MTTRYRNAWKKRAVFLERSTDLNISKYTDYRDYQFLRVRSHARLFALVRAMPEKEKRADRSRPAGARGAERREIHLAPVGCYRSSFPLNYVISESTLPIKGRRYLHQPSWIMTRWTRINEDAVPDRLFEQIESKKYNAKSVNNLIQLTYILTW